MNFYILLLSSQLLYYLLIAQTGIVGAFDSHIYDLYTLPIGGAIGSLMAGFIKHWHIKTELYIMFIGQLALSLIYPNYSLIGIFIFGFVIGYTTPILLFTLSQQKKTNLAIGLALTYAIGTWLYTYPFGERGMMAFILSIIFIASLGFVHIKEEFSNKYKYIHFDIILLFFLWIFLDSVLFETLSRSKNMDIWSNYTFIIIVSHIFGIMTAYKLMHMSISSKNSVTISLLLVSYILYLLKMPMLLSIVYPFTISWYNFALFSYIIKLNNILQISLSMIIFGWLATTMANGMVFSGYINKLFC